jgi:hypothetical protein
MKWLDEPRDGVEATLREALDEAAVRTGDEIAHRRVWTRISSPDMLPPSRVWIARASVLGVLAAAGAGAVLVWPDARPLDPPVVIAPAPATSPSQPETGLLQVIVREPLLEGPTTRRSDARNRAYLRLAGNTEVDLEPSSVFSLDRQNRPSIDKGRVSLSVPRQKPGHRFMLSAGPYQIAVLGTKFQVRVAGDSVGVDVEEGVVEVSRGSRVVRVEAGEAWTSPSGTNARSRVVRARERLAAVVAAPPVEPAEPVAPPSSATAEQFRQGKMALAEGHPQKAIEIFEALARGMGPTAENSAYEVGKILRYDLKRPRQALAAWYRYRARFPYGMLRAETDMSIIDALLVLGDKSGALAEANSFLARYPDNERRGDLNRIVRQLSGDSRENLSHREPAFPGTM